MATKDKATNGKQAKKTPGEVLPSSATELEQEIAQRRAHLAATIDELAARTKPQALVKSGVAGVTAKLHDATHDTDGSWRVERLAAVAGAIVAVSGVLVWLRRRRS